MPKLVAEVTSRSYAVEVPVEDFLALTRVENAFTFMDTLGERLDRLPGVSGAEYNGHFGSAIYFDVAEGEGNVDDAVALIEDHLALCGEADRLVTGNGQGDGADPDTIRPFFAAPGFVFCDRGDLGVSLHFRSGGEPCTKWFTDGAASQWREACAEANANLRDRGLRARVARKVALHLPEDYLDADAAPACRP